MLTPLQVKLGRSAAVGSEMRAAPIFTFGRHGAPGRLREARW